jgi:hypothetical protein
MRTANWILTLTLAASAGVFGVACQAQSPTSSTDSLAAAARRAREDKKNQPTKSAAVFTNDNLPTTGTISVVGAAPASSAAATTAAASTTAAQPAAAASPASADAKKASADEQALATAKARLANAKKDLDLLQRTYNLDQQSYLSNPNHTSDSAGAGNLQNEKNQIQDKTSEVDVDQSLVDTLVAKMPPQAPLARDDAQAQADSDKAVDSGAAPKVGTNPL